MIHAPKVESFDTEAMTNTDPKGHIRDVDRYEETRSGLYLARPTPGRPQFHYIESWLLPELNLRITDFHFNPGHEFQDFYLDVVDIERSGAVWRSTDLYLDLTLYHHDRIEVLDVDELLAAVPAGHISAEKAESVLRTGFATVQGIAANGYDLETWLAALNITLSWRRWPQPGR